MDTEIARKTWELQNNVITVDPSVDQIYYYDKEANNKEVNGKPWAKEWVGVVWARVGLGLELRLGVIGNRY